MGVGSEIFGLQLGLVVMMVNLQQYLLALIVVPLHIFFRWIYRNDPRLIKAYIRYMREADYYDPWTRRSIAEARPKGFGRGLHC